MVGTSLTAVAGGMASAAFRMSATTEGLTVCIAEKTVATSLGASAAIRAKYCDADHGGKRTPPPSTGSGLGGYLKTSRSASPTIQLGFSRRAKKYASC